MTDNQPLGIFIRLDGKTKANLTDYAQMRGKSVTAVVVGLIERELSAHKDELAMYLTERATEIKKSGENYDRPRSQAENGD